MTDPSQSLRELEPVPGQLLASVREHTDPIWHVWRITGEAFLGGEELEEVTINVLTASHIFDHVPDPDGAIKRPVAPEPHGSWWTVLTVWDASTRCIWMPW